MATLYEPCNSVFDDCDGFFAGIIPVLALMLVSGNPLLAGGAATFIGITVVKAWSINSR